MFFWRPTFIARKASRLPPLFFSLLFLVAAPVVVGANGFSISAPELKARLKKGMTPQQKTDMLFMILYSRPSVELVRLLLRHGLDPNRKDASGRLPLITAANNTGIVMVLLRHGVRVNIRDKQGNTPLIAAAKAHNRYVVRLLLRKGAKVNVRNKEGETPLLAAAGGREGDDHTDLIRLLIRHGARVDVIKAGRPGPGKFSETPLVRVARYGSFGSARLLIKHGANPKRDYWPKGSHPDGTVVGVAAKRGYLAVADLLNGKIKHNPEFYQGKDIYTAVIERDYALARRLLDGGLSPKSLTVRRAFGLAVALHDGKMAKLFLDRGYNINANIIFLSRTGTTLGNMTKKHDLWAMKFLLTHGESIEHVRVITPIYYSHLPGFSIEEVKLLLAHGADVNWRPRNEHGKYYGKTALDIAIRQANDKRSPEAHRKTMQEVVSFLRKAGGKESKKPKSKSWLKRFYEKWFNF